MGLGENWYHLGNKICYIPKVSNFSVKKISLLPGLKVSSSGLKCIFYRLKHNAKGGPHKTDF